MKPPNKKDKMLAPINARTFPQIKSLERGTISAKQPTMYPVASKKGLNEPRTKNTVATAQEIAESAISNDLEGRFI